MFELTIMWLYSFVVAVLFYSCFFLSIFVIPIRVGFISIWIKTNVYFNVKYVKDINESTYKLTLYLFNLISISRTEYIWINIIINVIKKLYLDKYFPTVLTKAVYVMDILVTFMLNNRDYLCSYCNISLITQVQVLSCL